MDINRTWADEKKAQREILKYLNGLSGFSFDKKQSSQYGNTNGFSDLVGTAKGHAVYIEIKSDSGSPSVLQMQFILKKKDCGAYGGFAKSIQDAIDICNGEFGREFPSKGWQK